MEDLGFAYAAHANKGVIFGMVRGISDFAAGKANGEKMNSQETTAVHAAAFAFGMLAGFIGGASQSLPPKLDTAHL
jgi:hypothetical protein